MAVKFGPELVTYPNGTPIVSAPIYVRKRGSLELAQLWSDALETSFAENPVMTDLAGNLVFFVDPGYYDLVHQGNEFPITVGETGSAPTDYTHVQTIPATVWTVTHNLGRRPPAVSVFSGDYAIHYDEFVVHHQSINELWISMDVATAGVAYLG